MPQIIEKPKVWDVCVIGSGAAGGTAAMVLTQGGLNVVLLEAGPMLNPEQDFREHAMPYDSPHRGAGVGGKYYNQPYLSEFSTPGVFWDIEGEPYTRAPGSDFAWLRARILGGRTNAWARISLRMSEWDFKPRSTDGMGDDWPISYEDLAPYYEKAETYIGVYGSKDTIASTPDGIFQPPPKPRCYELLIKKASDKLGILCVPGRPRSSPSPPTDVPRAITVASVNGGA